MQRTILELNAVPCIPLETELATKQQLIFSRSFSTPVTSAARTHEVMAIYAKRASIRLANDSQQAKLMTCFAGTSHFNQTAASFPPVTLKLPVPTADPVPLTKAATGALEGHIVDGVPYARAGVMLTDLSPASAAPQLPMFATAHEEKHIGPSSGTSWTGSVPGPSALASPNRTGRGSARPCLRGTPPNGPSWRW
jgi:DNA polymerase V